MIVTAYAEGDRRSLGNLLSRDVYEGFEHAIKERETAGETAETRFVVDRPVRHHRRRGARLDRARDRAVRLAAGFGHPRPQRQCDRRQPREGHRRHRRLDVRARPVLARSQLEARRHRSRAITGRTRDVACGFAASSECAAGAALLGLCDAVPLSRRATSIRCRHRTPSSSRSTWSELDGWADDDHAAAFATFRASCNPFLARRPAADERPISQALRDVCRRGRLPPQSTRTPRRRVSSKTISGRCASPSWVSAPACSPATTNRSSMARAFRIRNSTRRSIAARPIFWSTGRSPRKRALPQPSAVIGRLNAKKKLEPYFDRGAIEDGALDGQKLEICWIRDPWEAMTIQIQGSARVRLEDGTTLRLNYDAHNGHPYTAGRPHPDRAQSGAARRHVDGSHQPVDGAQSRPGAGRCAAPTSRSCSSASPGSTPTPNRPARRAFRSTPGRSIAVDRIHVYGTPFFIEAELPIESASATTPFRRLMMAQDTGSAIVGPARADLYFGAGDGRRPRSPDASASRAVS